MPTNSKHYVIEYYSRTAKEWVRSDNSLYTNDAVVHLSDVVFTNKDAAETLADRFSKHGLQYRVAEVPTEAKEYVIEYQSFDGVWERSGNRYKGERLDRTTFTDYNEAVRVAHEQEELSGFGNRYRVVELKKNKPQYVVEVNINGQWSRSWNDFKGLNLLTHAFTSKAEAEEAAQYNQKYAEISGSNLKYRAVEATNVNDQ